MNSGHKRIHLYRQKTTKYICFYVIKCLQSVTFMTYLSKDWHFVTDTDILTSFTHLHSICLVYLRLITLNLIKWLVEKITWAIRCLPQVFPMSESFVTLLYRISWWSHRRQVLRANRFMKQSQNTKDIKIFKIQKGFVTLQYQNKTTVKVNRRNG